MKNWVKKHRTWTELMLDMLEYAPLARSTPVRTVKPGYNEVR